MFQFFLKLFQPRFVHLGMVDRKASLKTGSRAAARGGRHKTEY